jgi:hypothetical protein
MERHDEAGNAEHRSRNPHRMASRPTGAPGGSADSVFEGDVMFCRIVSVLFGLIACAALGYQVAGQQPPSAGMRWIRLDVDLIVTIGRYGPLGEASSWADPPDLSKVDEVGFVDLMPGRGHGSGGYVNVAAFELYGTPVKRGEAK